MRQGLCSGYALAGLVTRSDLVARLEGETATSRAFAREDAGYSSARRNPTGWQVPENRFHERKEQARCATNCGGPCSRRPLPERPWPVVEAVAVEVACLPRPPRPPRLRRR